MQFRNTEDGRIATVSGDAAVSHFGSSPLWDVVNEEETPPLTVVIDGVIVDARTLGDPPATPVDPGITAADPIDPPPPADNAHVATGADLFLPAGNASREEWATFATQQGKDVDGLGRDEIRALFN